MADDEQAVAIRNGNGSVNGLPRPLTPEELAISPRYPAVGAAATEPPPCSPSGVPFQVMTAPVEEKLSPMPWTNNPHWLDTRYLQPPPRNEERIVNPAAALIGPQADPQEIQRALEASGWKPPEGLKIE